MEQDKDESEISFKSDHRKVQKKTFTQKLFGTCMPDTNDLHNTIPFKYFSCCFRPPEKEVEITDLDEYDGNIYMSNEEVDGVMSLFPSKYIRKDERSYIKFDKENIIAFYNNLQNDQGFIRKFEKFD